jgi:hypothetical protein
MSDPIAPNPLEIDNLIQQIKDLKNQANDLSGTGLDTVFLGLYGQVEAHIGAMPAFPSARSE